MSYQDFSKKIYSAFAVTNSTQTRSGNHGDLEKSTRHLIWVLLVGTLAAWWLGICAGTATKVMLWVMTFLVAGGLVGFLFGIPKSSAVTAGGEKNDNGDVSHGSDRGGRPNTNLEEVSDWLTKIIVGLSLVHLKDISAYVFKISQIVAASLTTESVPAQSDVSVAMALVIGFLVLGFLFGYLYTRLFLQGAFQRSDTDMYASRSRQAIADTILLADPPLGQPVVTTQHERQSAEQIVEVAPIDQPLVALAPLRSLAAEYEQIRRDGDYGKDRTKKMAEIARKMKAFALVAAQYLPQLTESNSPGERLAAIVALQMQFDPKYINWLAERLVEEPAFPAYQAASAFLARLPTVGMGEAQAIKDAVKSAVSRRYEKGYKPETTLDELCNKIVTYGQVPA